MNKIFFIIAIFITSNYAQFCFSPDNVSFWPMYDCSKGLVVIDETKEFEVAIWGKSVDPNKESTVSLEIFSDDAGTIPVSWNVSGDYKKSWNTSTWYGIKIPSQFSAGETFYIRTKITYTDNSNEFVSNLTKITIGIPASQLAQPNVKIDYYSSTKTAVILVDDSPLWKSHRVSGSFNDIITFDGYDGIAHGISENPVNKITAHVMWRLNVPNLISNNYSKTILTYTEDKIVGEVSSQTNEIPVKISPYSRNVIENGSNNIYIDLLGRKY